MEDKYLGLPECIREYAITVDNFCKFVINKFYELIDGSGIKRSDLYDDKGMLNKFGTYVVTFYLINIMKVFIKQYEYQLVGEYLKKYDL